MKLVVGLGNPGREYADTPHNAGFMVVDELARRSAVRLRRSLRFKARTARFDVDGNDAGLLIEPLTYMNLSGCAVGAIYRYRKAQPQDLLVIYDDADLPLGMLRIRESGGAGGHRGLTSVIEHIGRDDFARVRVGIGRAGGTEALVQHVLSPFAAAEKALMTEMVVKAADAVECIVKKGTAAAMNRFNVRAGKK